MEAGTAPATTDHCSGLASGVLSAFRAEKSVKYSEFTSESGIDKV